MRAPWRRERPYVAPFAVHEAVLDSLDHANKKVNSYAATVEESRLKLVAVRAAVREMNCSADRDMVLVALGEEAMTPSVPAVIDLGYGGDPCGSSTPAEVICDVLCQLHNRTMCMLAALVISELEDNGWVITAEADGSEDVRGHALREAAGAIEACVSEFTSPWLKTAYRYAAERVRELGDEG